MFYELVFADYLYCCNGSVS